MTTILLAGVLGFLVALAIVLTVIRMDRTRDTFTSDGSDDRRVSGRLKSGGDRHSVVGVETRSSPFNCSTGSAPKRGSI